MVRVPARAGLLLLLVSILASVGLFATQSAPVAAAQSTTNIAIQNFSFSPASITVVIGVNNTVVWTNKDSVTHTVTADDGSFGSSVPAGKTFTHTFTTAGIFSYHCSIHTFMKGTVVVLSGSSSSSTSSITTPPVTTSTTTAISTTSQPVTSQSSSSVSSSSGTTGTVPEFPFVTTGVVLLTVLVLASYVAARKLSRPGAA